MPRLRLLSAADQVAAHLRREMTDGIRTGMLPGVRKLAAELGVNHKTTEAALMLLEKEGHLTSQGPRRSRIVTAKSVSSARSGLRIVVFPMDVTDRGEDYHIELRHLLEEAGHIPFYTKKTLLDLGMNAERVANHAQSIKADARIVVAGSKEILSWFAAQPVPVFALFGRFHNQCIAAAGADKSPTFALAARRLVELGHRRISFLIRRQQRHPEPAPSVRAYLDELKTHGIKTGDFHLPDWEESKAGFQEILKSLFALTPPTALITDEAFLFHTTQQFLARRGIRVPEDVSLISTDKDPNLSWCEPPVTHIQWDYHPIVRRIVQWADNVSQGRKDTRQTKIRAVFVEGGTMGPAKSGQK